ncbi:ArgS-related anticodon-binding protein NrtL [Streptomyces sp. NPDC051211]|uniref:ArgS-related anticodon-binding protein NrtL n=1 Tax=Streptomyces sp. NPDC051211 TaxID=3154643 RepID=UPI00344EAE22
MNPAHLPRTVARALRCAVEEGELGVSVPGRVVVERSRPGGVGEYATPVAFGVAKAAGMKPAEVAQVLARRLAVEPGVRSVEVTGGGFLNFVLEPRPVAELVREVQALGPRYGWSVDAAGEAAPGVESLQSPHQSPQSPHQAPQAPQQWGGGREGVVREAVRRILFSQGCDQEPGEIKVAGLARRDHDLVRRLGAEAARWGMLAGPARQAPVLDGSLARLDESNPFFRVQYGYARSRALVRNAGQLGFRAEPGPLEGDAEALVRVLAEYPLVLEAAAHHREADRLARHLVLIADALLDFQYCVLTTGDEKPLAAHRARLALAEAAGTVLAGGLALLGIEASDRI